MSSARPTAGEVVQAHLRAQREVLRALDPDVRADRPDAVHQMRVATRRLRSALATYRPLFDRTRTDPLRDELRWLARALGGARDAEVLRERLLTSAEGIDPEVALGPVVRRIDQVTAARHRDAVTVLRTAMDDPRYGRLLEQLDRLVDDPPFTERARRPAVTELAQHVARTVRRVRRQAAAAGDAVTPAMRDALLHAVRKDAKRARYAAESVEPVLGDPAAKAGRRFKQLQQLLGEHQDSVVARQALREMGVAAHLAGENGFTFGLLHGLEVVRSERMTTRYPKVLRRATAARPLRWPT